MLYGRVKLLFSLPDHVSEHVAGLDVRLCRPVLFRNKRCGVISWLYDEEHYNSDQRSQAVCDDDVAEGQCANAPVRPNVHGGCA